MLINLLILLFLISCSTTDDLTKAHKPPRWYTKRASIKNTYLGYGDSKDLKEALSIAKKMISPFLYTDIQNKQKQFKISDEDENLYFNSRIEKEFLTAFSDIKVYKKIKVGNKWYVLLAYEKITTPKKIRRKIRPKKCLTETQNNYLKHTPLIKAINREVNCELNLNLTRHKGVWFLKYKKIRQAIYLNDFDKLFLTVKSENLDFNISKNRLITGEKFNFKIKTLKRGYTTIFNIYPNGEVGVLAENLPLRPNVIYSFPSNKSDVELTAKLPFSGFQSHELFVALHSKRRLKMKRFHNSKETSDTESKYKFHELIYLLGKYDFSSLLVNVYPIK